MYTTHGDMIIIRPNNLDRSPRTIHATRPRDGRADRRESRGERPREAWDDRSRSPHVEGLRERVAELEARVSRLEAQLERAGERRRERLYDPDVDRHPSPPRGPSRPPRRREEYPAERSQVRVSLHANGGAQVSLGEVRMISQE